MADTLTAVSGNKICVDCDAPNPDWASINLGILMCLECSGSHRHMGVHISQCRSLKLDTECWQGEMLTFMCSVGNAAFNRAWEKECPFWVIHPEEYPYLPNVRVHYIEQKYMYRQFLRKEVGDERASGCYNDPVWSGITQGPVNKRSPNNPLMPWQGRFIKFHLKNGDPVLSYYKDESYSNIKGEIELRDSFAGLVDKSDCEKDHQNSFHIRTSADSEHQGRDFLFSVNTPKEAILWVQSIRRQSGQESVKSAKAGMTPIMGGMEMDRLNLKRNAAGIIEREGVVFAGGILQREAYAYGRWYSRYAVVSKDNVFVFTEEGGNCICALPLLGGKVDKYPLNCDRDVKTPDGSFGVVCALSHMAFDAGSTVEKDTWIAAVESSITKITVGR